MTVKELIEMLQTYDEDMTVQVIDIDGYRIDVVEVVEERDHLLISG